MLLALELTETGNAGQEGLGQALRISCYYALPNTAKLLNRGANPNAVSAHGTTSIHVIVNNQSAAL